MVQSLQRSHWPGMYVRGAVTAEIPLARYVRMWCSHCRDLIGQVCTYVVQSLQRSHWSHCRDPIGQVYTYVMQSLQRSHWPVRTWCSHCRDPIGQVCTYVVQSLPIGQVCTYVVHHCRDLIGQVCTYVRGAVTAEISLARYVRTYVVQSLQR